MVGLGELLARLERRRQLLAAEGLFAPELKRALPFLPGLRRAGHRAQLRRRARRPRERPPALAGRALRDRARRHAGHARRRRGDGGGRPPRPPSRRRGDRGRAGRRLGGGPAAVLRRGADPGRAPGAAPPSCQRSGTSPTSRCSTWWPTSVPPRPPTPPSWSSPTSSEELRGVDLRPPADPLRDDRVRRSRAGGPRRAAVAPFARRPALAGRRPRRRGRPAARPRPAGACGTPSTGPPTTSHTSAPAPARCPRWPRCGAGTPYSRTPTATSSARSPASTTGADVAVRVADGRIHATTTRVDPDPAEESDD